MDDWESLKLKGNTALQNGDSEKAIEFFTEALELSPSNHILLSNRSAAYCKVENFAEALKDAEKVVKLKPDWSKGHSRVGLASFGCQDFITSRRSFEKALELEPANQQYPMFITKCNELVAKAGEMNPTKEEAEKKLPELAVAFAKPENIQHLRTHDRTKHYFKDREFEEKILVIHKDPTRIKEFMTEPRMVNCIGVLMGLNVVPSSNKKEEERTLLTISSDEEDELSESEDEQAADDQSIRAPISKSKKKTNQDGDETPQLTREQVREAVAKKMGVSVEKMDEMLGSIHKPKGDNEENDPTENLEIVLEKEGEETPAKELAPPPAPIPTPVVTPKPPPKVHDDHESIMFPIEPEGIKERKALSLEIKEKAATAYAATKYKSAIKLYAMAHKLDPTNMVFMNNIAAVHLTTKNFELCISTATEAIKIGQAQEADPKLIGKAYSRLGKAHTGLHQYDEAIAAHKASLQVDRCAQYLKLRDECLKAKNAHAKASMYDPLKAQGCKARGNEFYKKNEFPEGVKEYSEAISHDPENVQLVSRVLCNRAACYTKMFEMALAMEDCEQAIKLDPKFVKAYLRKGAVLAKTEQWQEAHKTYSQALKLDPHSFDARTGKEKAETGLAHLAKTDETRATAAMQDPKIRELWEDCRQLLKDMTDDPESRAVKKELEDPEMRWKLARLREAGLLG